MDLGPIPSHLPPLTIAGELLIARAHVTMNFWRYKGQQYQYTGNVISFIQNVPKIVSKLPALPSTLQILRLKPASSDHDSSLRREFQRHCRVKRADIQQWLEYLIDHHPAYRDLTIDSSNLNQLPEDDTIYDQLQTVDIVDKDTAAQDTPAQDTAPQQEPDLPPELSPQNTTAPPPLIEESVVPYVSIGA